MAFFIYNIWPGLTDQYYYHYYYYYFGTGGELTSSNVQLNIKKKIENDSIPNSMWFLSFNQVSEVIEQKTGHLYYNID